MLITLVVAVFGNVQLTGMVLAVILLMILGYANASGNLILFVGVLFFLLIAMGLYRSPAVALMPDLTPKPLRSKGNAVINLMGAIGGLMLLGVCILFATIKENTLRAGMVQEDESRAEEPKSTAQLPKEVKRSLIFILCSISLWFTAYNAVTTAFSRYNNNLLLFCSVFIQHIQSGNGCVFCYYRLCLGSH